MDPVRLASPARIDRNVSLTHPDRRLLLKAAGATLVGFGAGRAGASPAPDAFVPLGRIARRHDLLFGFALDPRRLDGLPGYASFVAEQATIVVPENVLKWASVHPAPGRFDFVPADSIATFARTHGIAMRGHTFCWHRALPDWVQQTVTPQTAQAVLVNHIRQVAGHYRGMIQSWDVANEVIRVEDGLPGGWRDSFWHRMLGPGFVDIAYRAAHDADPNAVLCYNDYGLETDSQAGQAKRAAVLTMLRGMRQRGVPIGALGLQSHLRANDPACFGPGLAGFIGAVRKLGLAVYVTELDVDDSHLDPSVSDGVVAAMYKRYLDLVLATGAVSAVLNWGVWDGLRSASATAAQPGPSPSRPLIFGRGGTLKDASWAVEHCLERA